jgi:GTP-binding protein HflX
LLSTQKEIEKAILVCTTIPKKGSYKPLKQKAYKEHLEELEFLTQTAGAEVIGKFYQERENIDSKYFIGRGKAQEIAEKVKDENVDLVIFENALSPTQIRNLEKLIECKVIDKPALILDIFASNARTSEAKTQVELAQLQYLLPRLTRQWTHLSKQYGGIGTKGPGETQIETDRRLINTRIAVLKDKLKKIEEQRKTQRQQRKHFIRIGLVGYTNAGKSTLLNVLTDADVYVEDKLFATLDTSTRLLQKINQKKIPHPVLISDTVGFIRNLPHDLIESFKSTLAEVIESDILIHVIDISSESFEEQIKVVEETLSELYKEPKPVIMVFNKVDLLDKEQRQHLMNDLRLRFLNAVFISAQKGINLNALEEEIIEVINKELAETEIRIPIENEDAYKFVNKLHEEVEILETKYLSKSIKLKIRAARADIDRIQKSLKQNSNGRKEKVL